MTLPDTDAFVATYGGAAADLGITVVDPTTDRPAAAGNKMFCGAAMLTHLAWRAVVKITASGIPINGHFACWGDTPDLCPTAVRVSTGLYTITWPTTVTDALGVVHTVSFRAARAKFYGSAVALLSTCTPAANVVTLRIFGNGATPASLIDPVDPAVAYVFAL